MPKKKPQPRHITPYKGGRTVKRLVLMTPEVAAKTDYVMAQLAKRAGDRVSFSDVWEDRVRWMDAWLRDHPDALLPTAPERTPDRADLFIDLSARLLDPMTFAQVRESLEECSERAGRRVRFIELLEHGIPWLLDWLKHNEGLPPAFAGMKKIGPGRPTAH